MQGLLVEARDRLITFATSEWLELAPDLVRGLERRLRRLAPGVSIGDELPPPRASTSQLLVPVPATSQSSAASSPVVAPPMSTTPSASSGNTGPLTQASDDGPTARPSRPPPRAAYRRARFSSPDDAPLPPTAATFAPRVTLPALADPAPREPSSSLVPGPAPPAAASDPGPPSASSRTSKKRPASPRSPKSKWRSCQRCRAIKKRCTRVAGSAICVLCQSTGSECVPSTSASFVFRSLPVV